MKTIFLILTATAALLLAACRDVKPDYYFEPKPEDRLTQTEINVLEFHAKQFIYQSKKLKLSREQKDVIRKTSPKVSIRYWGHKYGRLDFEWQLSRDQVLLLTSKGHLRDDKQNWTLEIKSMRQTHPVPPGFLKEEDMFMPLPPK